MTDDESRNRLIEMGVFSVPHGVRGQIKLRSFTECSEDIASYNPLQDKHGKRYVISIAGHAGDMLIANAEGITSRNEAEKLKNVTLYAPRYALPTLKKGEYYHEDLINLAVATRDGKDFGTILSVHNFGAGTLVNIKLSNGGEEFLPFNATVFPEVDIKKGVAVIDPPFVLKNEQSNE